MRIIITLLLASSSVLLGSQIFYMDMDESLFFTEAVVVAEVSDAIEFPMDYFSRTEYIFEIQDVIHGPDSLRGSFLAQYVLDFPRSYTDEDGNEVWESPLVSGSGIEMSVDKGDTVIVFIGYMTDDPHQHSEVVRLEPIENMDLVIKNLAEMEE